MKLNELLSKFFKDETISGKLILVTSVLALIVANSPLQGLYERIWHVDLTIGPDRWSMTMSLRHWVNECLMAIFFLVVGLEIKRELVSGELRDLKVAALPIAAALGGMIAPAVIYLGLNVGTEVSRGWGIPIATDIAFAVGVLMLLGKRIPLSLKLFLLTLAIADDIGAILVIALFYANGIHPGYLGVSLLLLTGMWMFNPMLSKRLGLFVFLGGVLWLTTHLSGVHASIAGAALGLIAPVEPDAKGHSGVERLEHFFLPVSTFFVLPLFAFSSAGVVLSLNAFTAPSSGSVMGGIIGGLAIGKMVGIVSATWLMVRFGRVSLPTGTGWPHIIGVGLLAGIGFTVSMFITDLAFSANGQILETAKIAVFIASSISAVLGILILRRAKPPEH